MRRLAIVTVMGLTAGCVAEARGRDERVVTIIATAEVKGTPEPCGCNSDPLGDVARVTTLARGGLLVDAGGLLYDRENVRPERRAQADAKAALLAKVYSKGEVGLGADDLVHGSAKAAPPRQASGVEGPLAKSPPRVRLVDGVKVGVFGVVSKAQLEGTTLACAPSAEAARAAVKRLEREGAQVIVGLLGMTRAEARELMTAVDGISFGIVGAEVGEGMPEPEPVGKGFLVAPADLARRVARIELHVLGGLDGKIALAPFAGESARKLQSERLERKLRALDEQLAAWKKDPTADRGFVAAREAERAELTAERARLATTPPTPPTTSYFTYALEPVRVTIPRDPTVDKQLKQLARDIGAANLAAARGTPPPPADEGEPHYLGRAACEKCHKPAVEFWQKTVHASAWKTLVDAGKQYDYDCIGCHVTGFQRAGGSNLASVEKQHLTDVQCEVCHGPGSKHVAEAGLDDPKTLVRKPADRFCADNCHTKEHSDTFQLAPYLRDVLGKGHGEKSRAQLGDGPTGHELRVKALAAAGR